MRSLLPAALALAAATTAARADYDPLQIEQPKADYKDVSFKDAKRGRELPLRVYLPKAKGAAPVVLFSHGLGGTREGGTYLGHHWAGRGYAAVFVQHPGSDDSVWKDVPAAQRAAALAAAASGENLILRTGDVSAVLDQLAAWNAEDGHFLAGRLDLKRVGMSGHSFGAVTAQAVGGQAAARGKGATDDRIRAAVLMSPSPPRLGGDLKAAFGGVKIPWLLLTGTHDTAAVGGTDAKSRLLVFPALPAGGKYELVLDGAEHAAFADGRMPGAGKRNPNHHRAILATTTAFWDAYLRNDAAARRWLDGDAVRDVFEKGDRWQKK